MTYFDSSIRGTIEADEIELGVGITLEAGVHIKSRRVKLGDFCYIGELVKILVPEFELGDYTKLHAFSFCHGDLPMSIGRNCWIGGGVVLDSNGGLEIQDGVGIGSHSQLWTHIRFGDIVQGCRFHSAKRMTVGRDAWLVGHCLVSPVSIGERSMAMLGSVITRDMLPNRVYAGVPAQDVTDKIGGPQFLEIPRAEKELRLQALIDQFERRHPEFIGQLPDFNLDRRTYRKTLSEAEVAFMKENVPVVKFVPEES